MAKAKDWFVKKSKVMMAYPTMEKSFFSKELDISPATKTAMEEFIVKLDEFHEWLDGCYTVNNVRQAPEPPKWLVPTKKTRRNTAKVQEEIPVTGIEDGQETESKEQE